MVTITFETKFSKSNKRYVDIYDVRCLSTDAKPTTGMTNGSSCIEIDTGDIYFFDGDSETWIGI